MLSDLLAHTQAAFAAYSAETRSPGSRMLIKLSKAKMRKVHRLRSEWERARETERAIRDANDGLEQTIQQAEQRKIVLEREKIEHIELNAELEELYVSIFGHTPSSSSSRFWPRQAEASSAHAINLLTARLLAAEIGREKRAREFLLQGKTQVEKLVKDLQAALQHFINTGVATNQKYTRQLFMGNSTLGTAKAVTPLLLAAKTSSGKLHEQHTHARVMQPLMQALPALNILELHLLPGRGSAKAVDEKGLHRSIEASYAQARQCAAHVRREGELSRARSKELEERERELLRTCEASLAHLRAVRADIVVRVLHGEPSGETGSEGGGRRGAENAGEPPQQASLGEQDIDREARAALRAIVCSAARRTADGSGDDRDDLPE
ncbi:hypothetical protein K437DRAFT_270375 [Tilletiaria anomala UBC 951]|uniref:Uncharacterized protein n=1 Tax=Tilletiaria anomala (strain ATCC 24038 / CBS 436.72 / UBC 951) TaxID=1037660 RepID=A0A066VKQ1_TILAU|nr:uncharacterized protein K437DRAFT_270375 [Tilletiaria anomala UBC 951]KDN39165.1 hypothetical protein K437DRAFT_270375 [Tilletiaria anomala UBC 951]